MIRLILSIVLFKLIRVVKKIYIINIYNMEHSETTVNLEAASAIQKTGKTGENIIENITNFSQNMWTQHQEIIVIGGLIIIGVLWISNKK